MEYKYVPLFIIVALFTFAGVAVIYNWWQSRRRVVSAATNVVSIDRRRQPVPVPVDQRRRDDDDGLAGSYAASQLAGFPVGGNAAGALLGTLAHQKAAPDELCQPDSAGPEEVSDSSDVCVPDTDDLPDQGGYESTDSGGFDPNN